MVAGPSQWNGSLSSPSNQQLNLLREGRGEEGKRGRGEEGKRGRGEEGKRGRGEEGKRGRGEEGKRGRGVEAYSSHRIVLVSCSPSQMMTVAGDQLCF